MSFEESILQGFAKEIPINTSRAKSMKQAAEQAVETACDIPVTEKSAKSILRELYEGMREYCEAIGYSRGYKFHSHESITYFITDVLNEQHIAKRFDRYRKLRNGINYFGNDIALETVKKAREEIPKVIKRLYEYMN